MFKERHSIPMDDIPSYLKHYMISNNFADAEDKKEAGGVMSPSRAYNWLEMAKTIEKSGDRNLDKMFKRHIKTNLDGDKEYNEVYRAFTYGLQLNRAGDRRSWYEI